MTLIAVVVMVLLIRGINVLENKSELEKAMAKQRLATEQKQKEAEVINIMIMMPVLISSFQGLVVPL